MKSLLEENEQLKRELAECRRRESFHPRTVLILDLKHDLIAKLNSSSGLTDFLDCLLDTFISSGIFSAGGVLLENDLTGNLLMAANRGFSGDTASHLSVVEKESQLFSSLPSADAEFNISPLELFPSLPRSADGPDSESRFALLPVVCRGCRDAVIVLNCRGEERFSEIERRLLRGTAFIVGRAIERCKADEALRKASDEKDVLLREINHRIKNSLTMIVSFIRLGQDEVTCSECVSILDQLGNKVESIAMIYQHLYSGNSAAGIELKSYLTTLIPRIVDSMSHEDRITIDLFLSQAVVDVDSGLAIGLIITELITNTLKHGYDRDRAGRIAVSFTHSKSGFLLEYRDYGRGLPLDYLERSENSLGIQLIQSLTDQLQGSLEVDPRNSRFMFALPSRE